MSAYILPLFILALIVAGFFKKVPIYGSFVAGVKGSLQLLLSIMPYFTTILIAIELFTASGLGEKLTQVLKPLFTAMGIPAELSQLVILRPLSGNGSIAALQTIIDEYGADSYIARCGSVIVGASETTFYVATIYFSTVKEYKLRYAIPVCLLASLIGAAGGCALCKIM